MKLSWGSYGLKGIEGNNVSKTIQALAIHFEFDLVSLTQEDLKLLLRALSTDSHPDVRFYSEVALRRI
jgi:hypothetical protein